MPRKKTENRMTRRSLVLAGTASLLASSLHHKVYAAGSDTIKIGMIGCGGRGTGATIQFLANPGTKLVAMADVFPDRLAGSLKAMQQRHPDQVDVSESRQFTGLDGYKNVLNTDADVIIHATPPGFRPLHFAAIVAAGKHVFLEKPMAVDAPGVRSCLQTGEQAKLKNLSVVFGCQRRYEQFYRAGVRMIQDGILGKLQRMRAVWWGQGIWVREREPSQTELEYQLRNWYYFTWLCGDTIVEQNIHNIDACLWAANEYPVSATATGGRDERIGSKHGQIFDNFRVDYRFASGLTMEAASRHQRNKEFDVSEYLYGTRGECNLGRGKFTIDGQMKEPLTGFQRGGHAAEQVEFCEQLRAGRIINDTEWGAYSTLTAIMGRMAAYERRTVTWDEVLNSQKRFASPERLSSVSNQAPTLPDKFGDYEVPARGI